jgi:hypothetical protein
LDSLNFNRPIPDFFYFNPLLLSVLTRTVFFKFLLWVLVYVCALSKKYTVIGLYLCCYFQETECLYYWHFSCYDVLKYKNRKFSICHYTVAHTVINNKILKVISLQLWKIAWKFQQIFVPYGILVLRKWKMRPVKKILKINYWEYLRSYSF